MGNYVGGGYRVVTVVNISDTFISGLTLHPWGMVRRANRKLGEEIKDQLRKLSPKRSGWFASQWHDANDTLVTNDRQAGRLIYNTADYANTLFTGVKPKMVAPGRVMRVGRTQVEGNPLVGPSPGIFLSRYRRGHEAIEIDWIALDRAMTKLRYNTILKLP